MGWDGMKPLALNQTKAAQAIGVTPQTIRNWIVALSPETAS